MKKQPFSSERFIVTSEEMADIIINSDHWRMLALFANQERNLSQAASILNLKLPSLTYRVNKWLDLGLLEVSREEKRHGRAIKYYQAVSKRFFIPFTLTKSETLEDFLIEMTKSTHEATLRETAHVLHNRKGDWGFLFYSSNEPKGPTFSANIVNNAKEAKALHGADQPALFETLSKLRLSFDTAKELQRDLEALHNKYQGKQVNNQQEYLIRLGLTPLRAGTKIL